MHLLEFLQKDKADNQSIIELLKALSIFCNELFALNILPKKKHTHTQKERDYHFEELLNCTKATETKFQ